MIYIFEGKFHVRAFSYFSCNSLFKTNWHWLWTRHFCLRVEIAAHCS